MRTTTLFLSLALCSAPALAQANDWAGISIQCDGVTPPFNAARDVTCGSAFSCAPLPLIGQRGDTVRYFLTGTFNGLYVLAASVDTNGLGCVNLGLPFLVNSLILPPASLVSLAVGFCTVSDNGRCNGGATPSTVLFTIPTNLPPGSIAFQGAVEAPLSAGGTGLALTRAIALTYN
jgi:hypothetical protein